MTQNVDKDAAAEADLDAELDQLTATKETLEDYTLRFAPRSYRKWSTRVVGISALGGIAYLADFAIGANIGIAYGTTNALWGILIFAVVIFATGFPLAYYAARYNIDLDLITRGSGFGYYGSVVTNVIFATFTFIFFALEGSIMAQGLKLGLGIPLLARLCGLDVDHLPAGHLRHESAFHTAGLDDSAVADPDGGAVRLPGDQPPRLGRRSSSPTRASTGNGATNLGSILLAAGVCLSLIAQIAEQIDYLRFMPPRTPENARSWWTWMILAGPGWVIFGAIKQIVGLFLAVYLIANVVDGAAIANQPVHQFLEIYRELHAGLAGHDAGRGPGRDQPDQDQRHQRLLGLAGVDELVHPRHQALPGPAGLPRGEPADRPGPDGSQHVRLPQHHPRLLRQLRHGLGRRGGLRHRVQQVPAEDLADAARVPPRHALRGQPGRLRLDAHRGRRVDRWRSSAASARRSGRTRRWWPSGWPWCCRRSSRSRPRASTTCAAPTTASTCRCTTSTATRPAST